MVDVEDACPRITWRGESDILGSWFLHTSTSHPCWNSQKTLSWKVLWSFWTVLGSNEPYKGQFWTRSTAYSRASGSGLWWIRRWWEETRRILVEGCYTRLAQFIRHSVCFLFIMILESLLMSIIRVEFSFSWERQQVQRRNSFWPIISCLWPALIKTMMTLKRVLSVAWKRFFLEQWSLLRLKDRLYCRT